MGAVQPRMSAMQLSAQWCGSSGVCRLVAVCPVAARGGVPSAVRLYEEAYP